MTKEEKATAATGLVGVVILGLIAFNVLLVTKVQNDLIQALMIVFTFGFVLVSSVFVVWLYKQLTR